MKKLVGHSVLYAIGPQVPRFANLLVLPMITPYLSTLDYGIQGVLSSYTGMLSGLSELGLTIILVNTYYAYAASDRWRFHWTRIFGFLILWSLVYGALLTSVIYLIMPAEIGSNKLTILGILFIQSVLFSSTSLIGGRLFQLKERPQYIAWVSSITGLVAVSANLYFIKYMQLGYMGWYYSGFISATLLFVFYIIPLVRKFKLYPSLNFNWRYIRQHLKVGLPTVPHNYSSYLLTSSDRFVMDRLNINLNELGSYNVGYSFGSYFNFVGTAVGMAQGPIMAKLWFKETLESKLQIRSLVFFLQVCFLVAGFLLAIWSKELLPMLYRNKSFEGAYIYASIVFMSYVYFPLYWASINKLFYTNQTKKVWRISFVGGVVNVILNFVFIPIYGPMAAAVTTFFCLMYVGTYGFRMKEYKKLNDVRFYPVHWLVLIAVCLGIAFYTVHQSISIKVVVSAIVLIIVTVLFLRFKPKLTEIEF